MARLDKLWRAVGGPGTPPGLDTRRVKARVNAALDTDETERKGYMTKKLRVVLIAAAAAVALMGAAFATNVMWDPLAYWFQGDVSSGREYVDSEARTVSGQDYALTVEGSVGDERNVFMTVTITALSDKAKTFIHASDFISIGTFDILVPAKEPDAADGSLRPVGFSSKELKTEQENSRRFRLAADDLPYPVDTLFVCCGYMEEGKRVEVPVTPAPSVTVQIGASGTGDYSGLPVSAVDSGILLIKEVALSPFTCQVKAEAASQAVKPRIFLRMADGSIRTQSQVMEETGGEWQPESRATSYSYRFKEIMTLESIAAVIVFDREYPLDGSQSVPVQHDFSLDPFTIRRMEPLAEGSGFSVPVQELTERLGGTFSQDAAKGEAACTYRGVTIVLQAGNETALVDGEAVEMFHAPAMQDGGLAAGPQVFRDAWGIDIYIQREKLSQGADADIVWGDWNILP